MHFHFDFMDIECVGVALRTLLAYNDAHKLGPVTIVTSPSLPSDTESGSVSAVIDTDGSHVGTSGDGGQHNEGEASISDVTLPSDNKVCAAAPIGLTDGRGRQIA